MECIYLIRSLCELSGVSRFTDGEMVRLRELFLHLLPFESALSLPSLDENRRVCGPTGAPPAITRPPKESPHVQMSSTVMTFTAERGTEDDASLS